MRRKSRRCWIRLPLRTEQVTEKPKGLITLSVEPTIAQKWLVPRLAIFMNNIRTWKLF